MEKQLSATGYWLGLICTVLALIVRLLTALNKIPPFAGVQSTSREQRPRSSNLLRRQA